MFLPQQFLAGTSEIRLYASPMEFLKDSHTAHHCDACFAGHFAGPPFVHEKESGASSLASCTALDPQASVASAERETVKRARHGLVITDRRNWKPSSHLRHRDGLLQRQPSRRVPRARL